VEAQHSFYPGNVPLRPLPALPEFSFRQTSPGTTRTSHGRRISEDQGAALVAVFSHRRLDYGDYA